MGHIATFCPNDKVSSTNIQVEEVHEEAAQQLLNAIQQEANSKDYYANLFSCEDQERRSASFQVTEGVYGGSIL